MDLNDNRLKFCISCLCGIPGSGKSTICEQLYHQLKEEFLIMTINFDKILLDSSSNTPRLWKSLDPGQFETNGENIMKSARNQILRVVEFLIQQIITGDPNGLWKELTKPSHISEEVWQGVLTVIQDSVCACDFQKIHEVLFLIDDNLYFSSMRYEFYKIAKLYRTGFCEIFVNSSIEKAKERNKKRTGRYCVADDVIERMHEKLEIPDSSKNSWEKFNSVLSIDISEDLTDVIQTIKEAFANPAQAPPQVDAEERLQSQTICSASVIHQVDLILRKCVSQTMMRGKENSENLKELAKESRFIKEEILCLVKNGEICIPPEFICLSNVFDSSKDETSEMFKYITTLYDCNLKCYNKE